MHSVLACFQPLSLDLCAVLSLLLLLLRLPGSVVDAEYAEYAAGLDDYLRSRGAAGPDPDGADRPVAAKVANRRSYLSDK
jgi:hypothetical protein